MKYVLMFAGSRGDQDAWDNMTEEQKSAAYGSVMERSLLERKLHQ